MIQLKNVSKFYHSKGIISSGISKINLTLDKGEFVVITGQSGSGKTTLLNVISGLDSYEEGEMYIDGKETSHFMAADFEKYRNKYIGNIFQNYNLVNSYTVYQNVDLSLRINGYRWGDRRRRVKEILAKVGLSDFAKTKASKLSGGQKQRVAIARALAKDTDIIVADEPTGNLDSEAARDVAALLSEIAEDKLVIVVTHNYEQFAGYATRRVKLHDGSIIENMVLKGQGAGQAETADSGQAEGDGRGQIPEGTDAEISVVTDEGQSEGTDADGGKATQEIKADASAEKGKKEKKKKERKAKPPKGRISLFSRFRLGWRNTFNIAYKFVLLLIVFLFMVVAVTSQYTSYLNQKAENDAIGYNSYFYNYSQDRIVLKKKDNSVFKDDDYSAIANIRNVDRIVNNDMVLDQTVYLENDDFTYETFMHTTDEFFGEVEKGRLPEGENEIVLVGNRGDYMISGTAGDDLLDKTFNVSIGTDTKLKLTVVGIAYKETGAYETAGDIYMSVERMRDVRMAIYDSLSTVTSTVNGQIQEYSPGSSYYRIIANDKVKRGEAMVFEEVNSYFEDGEAVGHHITIDVNNMYYHDSKKLKMTDVYKEKGFSKKTGFKSFDEYGGAVFISKEDYEGLFLKGNYQCSVFVKDIDREDETLAALQRLGYITLPLRDALVKSDNDITSFMQVPMIIIILCAIFFIGYIVIRLIFRSRTSYFSILRMLGMSKRHMRDILTIELFLVMNIAFAIFMAVILLVNIHIINVEYIATLIKYMQPRNYVILYAVMTIMSLLIAGRFSRRLFRKTAMGSFREEA